MALQEIATELPADIAQSLHEAVHVLKQGTGKRKREMSISHSASNLQTTLQEHLIAVAQKMEETPGCDSTDMQVWQVLSQHIDLPCFERTGNLIVVDSRSMPL